MSSTDKGSEKEKTAEAEPKKRGRRSMFTDDQKQILLKYYDNGMTSTNRHHVDVIEKCARECQTTVDKIKRFIGAENYKRKKAQNVDVDEAPKPKKRKSTPTKQKKGKEMTDEDEEEEEEPDDEPDDERFIAAENFKVKNDDVDEASKPRKRKSPPLSKAKQKKGKETTTDEDEEEEQDDEYEN